MSTIKVCDECGGALPRFYLRVIPSESFGLGESGEVVFLDGSWNGGDFCTTECARSSLAKVKNPEPQHA